MIFFLVFVQTSTLILSVVLPIVIKPVLEKLGIIDVPNARSSHTRPVMRGLGLATMIAMAGGFVMTLVLSAGVSSRYSAANGSAAYLLGPTPLVLFVTIALVSVAAGIMGLAEDLKGLRVMLRSALQLSLALIAVTVFVSVTGQLWLWVPYGVLFISSYINVANFMDGINGISGMHGVLAGATFATAGLLSEQPWLAFAGVILAAAFAGFLPWNFMGSGAFLGDVGSYLLGASVATISLAAAVSGVPWLATIAPMIFYFGDSAYTLVRRVRRGEKWYEAHKEHVYQRINQLGYSHLQTTAIISAFTLAACALGIASFWITGFAWWLLLAGGLALTGLYLLMPRILPARHARVA